MTPTAQRRQRERIREAHAAIDNMLKALFDSNMNTVERVNFSTDQIIRIKDSLNYLVRLARQASRMGR